MSTQELTRPISGNLTSILIPVYNREAHIADCVKSALAQASAFIEVIICDNASTDNTYAICEQLAKSDSRIRLFKNSCNLGPVRNWQRCAELASGEYAKFLFSDDEIAPDYLKLTLPFLANPNVGFVTTAVRTGHSSQRSIVAYKWPEQSGIRPAGSFLDTALFSNRVTLSIGAAIFRMADVQRNILTDIPSPTIDDFPRHGAGPDFLLYLLTAKDYQFVAHVPEPLCFFRDHEGAISVVEGRHRLVRSYLQARIWFANTYTPVRKTKKLLVRSWLAEIVREKHAIAFSDFAAQYLTVIPRLSATERLWFAISSILTTMFIFFSSLVRRRMFERSNPMKNKEWQ